MLIYVLKVASVILIAAVLVLIIGVKFLLPIYFLLRGYGVDMPMPMWLSRMLPLRFQVWFLWFGGPILVIIVIWATWFVLRHIKLPAH